MIRRPVKEFSAEFTAEERSLEGIQRTVREACTAAGLPRKDITAVLLAIEEGATNIIRHAYLYEKGVLRLRIAVYKQLIVFSLIDTGRSFQASGSGRLDLNRLVETGRKGGLGFYMIQKIMDSVEYISASGTNELRLIKRISPVTGDERPLLRRLMTLRVRFSMWTFLIVAVIVGSAYYYLDSRTSRQLRRHLDDTVLALAETMADQAAGYLLNRRSDAEFDQLTVSYLRANPELQLIVLTDSAGLIMAHSEDIRSIRQPYQTPADIDESRILIPQLLSPDAGNLAYLITPIKAGERLIGCVHLVYTSELIHEQIAEARWRIAVLTGVLLLFGVLGIYYLSSRFVQPIMKITQRVRRFTSGDLETELPLEGAEEFFDISRAFNEMLTRLNRDRKNLVAQERLAREVELAAEIQKTLFPQELPAIPGLELEAFYRAAESMGGDLYDVFAVAPNRYCLVVADVSGKGVPASLVMSILRTVIRILAAQATSARDTLMKVQAYFERNIPSGMFITIQLLFYDSDSRELTVVSAGHNPMLLYRSKSNRVRSVNPSGMALGVPVTLGQSFEETLRERRLRLKDGDGFIIFTDGVTEALNHDREQFGADKLAGLLREQLSGERIKAPADVRRTIVDELERFCESEQVADDVAFIVARATVAETTPDMQAQEDRGQPVLETQTVGPVTDE
ncbi:MAG: SpoIIE family protein phosphatase [Candidatus Zixiibacteriota bacterium]